MVPLYTTHPQLFCITTCMSNSDLTSVLFLLLLLVGFAQLLGYLFVKMRQPKVIGEILAGIVLGLAVPFGLLFGVARFDPRVRSEAQLEHITGLVSLTNALWGVAKGFEPPQPAKPWVMYA